MIVERRRRRKIKTLTRPDRISFSSLALILSLLTFRKEKRGDLHYVCLFLSIPNTPNTYSTFFSWQTLLAYVTLGQWLSGLRIQLQRLLEFLHSQRRTDFHKKVNPENIYIFYRFPDNPFVWIINTLRLRSYFLVYLKCVVYFFHSSGKWSIGLV